MTASLAQQLEFSDPVKHVHRSNRAPKVERLLRLDTSPVIDSLTTVDVCTTQVTRPQTGRNGHEAANVLLTKNRLLNTFPHAGAYSRYFRRRGSFRGSGAWIYKSRILSVTSKQLIKVMIQLPRHADGRTFILMSLRVPPSAISHVQFVCTYLNGVKLGQ